MEIAATSLYRALACDGSLSLVGQIEPTSEPTEDSDDKREGIAAHFVASQVLSGVISDPLEYVERQMPNGVFVTPEMAEFVDRYTAEILAREDCEDFVETNTDYAFQAPGYTVTIRGRADHIGWRLSDLTLFLDDFKYGWRLVEPDENWALIAHAIGHIFRFNIRPERIVFTIHQPRPFHRLGQAREWELTYDELLAYHAAICERLSHRTNALVTGDHCHDCPAIAYCEAARRAGLNSIEAVATARVAENMSDDEIAYELMNIERAEDMLSDRKRALEELGKHRLKSGRIIHGYSLEPTYGRDTWNEGVNNQFLQALTGLDLSVPKIKTPKQAIKAGANPAVIAPFYAAPFTGVKLVRSDANRRAKQLFEPKGK
jgi:hypothetical protein